MFFSLHIRSVLARQLKPTKIQNLTVTTKSFPRFRFPDFHRGVEAFLKTRSLVRVVESSHPHMTLSEICTGQSNGYIHGTNANKSPTMQVPVDYRRDEVLPTDCFWVFRLGNEKEAAGGIIRVQFERMQRQVSVEVAATNATVAAEIMDEICKLSVTHSVYRGKLLELGLFREITDEFGDVSTPAMLDVSFRPDPEVTADDIVLDGEIAAILERNVVRFHQMRQRLKQLGLPLQRGVLLHGPPGTGKTFTCQYLFHRLKPVTMIVVAGKGLTEVKSICSLARTLQPSVVVLEDIDLIFTSREVNLYSTGLGDMMDELDGFNKDEAVTFILTTNAIDRLEQAIKDRPGRVSQCIYFGLPNAELRHRYLVRFTRDYATDGVDFEEVVRLSNGGSQAFLQEVVNRAVQIAAEAEPESETSVELTTAHFAEAIAEMTRFTQKATENIIGFQRGD